MRRCGLSFSLSFADIIAGHDEAPPGVNDFIMNDWQIFATRDVTSQVWQHYADLLSPVDERLRRTF